MESDFYDYRIRGIYHDDIERHIRKEFDDHLPTHFFLAQCLVKFFFLFFLVLLLLFYI